MAGDLNSEVDGQAYEVLVGNGVLFDVMGLLKREGVMGRR